MQSIEMESVPCPLGCLRDDEVILTGRDILHNLPGVFQVVRCRSCKLMRTSPRPTMNSIGVYYPADYGPYLGTRVLAKPLRKDGNVRRWLIAKVRAMFDTKAHALPTLCPGRMLEIGCASGSFLHEMALSGWQVEGIELSREAADAARTLGYSVDTGAVESIEKRPEIYDLIVGWMVLEHLHDPVASLRKLRDWAKPGAWLAVSVPDSGSMEFKIFGARWYALQLPSHLFHYDARTITKLLESGGWEIDSIHYQRNLSNLVASAGYWLRDKINRRVGEALVRFPERSGRVWMLVLWIPALLLSWFGQTGRMTVWARRKS